MIETKACAAINVTAPPAPFCFSCQDPGPDQIEIQIQYCGTYPTVLHQARNGWKSTTCPCVPGHEIIGPRPGW